VRKRWWPPRSAAHCASTVCSGEKNELPIARTLPDRIKSESADNVSSMSVTGSGRCIWYRSMWSVPNHRRLSSTAVLIQRREPPR
jgi:hypothetical protein